MNIETALNKIADDLIETAINKGPIVGTILKDGMLSAKYPGGPYVIIPIMNMDKHWLYDTVSVGKDGYLFNNRTKGRVILKDDLPFFSKEMMDC